VTELARDGWYWIDLTPRDEPAITASTRAAESTNLEPNVRIVTDQPPRMRDGNVRLSIKGEADPPIFSLDDAKRWLREHTGREWHTWATGDGRIEVVPPVGTNMSTQYMGAVVERMRRRCPVVWDVSLVLPKEPADGPFESDPFARVDAEPSKWLPPDENGIEWARVMPQDGDELPAAESQREQFIEVVQWFARMHIGEAETLWTLAARHMLTVSVGEIVAFIARELPGLRVPLAAVPLTVKATIGDEPTVRIVRSAAEWREMFGTEPPPGTFDDLKITMHVQVDAQAEPVEPTSREVKVGDVLRSLDLALYDVESDRGAFASLYSRRSASRLMRSVDRMRADGWTFADTGEMV
jgi:hypothetical protein